MRCVFGHWVIGFWRSVYLLPDGRTICDRHASMLQAYRLSRVEGIKP